MKDLLYDFEGVFVKNHESGPFDIIRQLVEDSRGRLGTRIFKYTGERVTRTMRGDLEPSERGSRVFMQVGPTEWTEEP